MGYIPLCNDHRASFNEEDHHEIVYRIWPVYLDRNINRPMLYVHLIVTAFTGDHNILLKERRMKRHEGFSF